MQNWILQATCILYRALVARAIDADGRHQHQTLADMKSVDLNREQVGAREIAGHELFELVRRERHEAPRSRRFRQASSGAGRDATPGSRTERANLRVETLINIWFIAQRPSQSSPTALSQLGSETS